MARIILNVGGTKFETYTDTILCQKETMLGKMFSAENSEMLKKDKQMLLNY